MIFRGVKLILKAFTLYAEIVINVLNRFIVTARSVYPADGL